MDLDVIKDFKTIAQMAHDNAIAKGFWDDEIKHDKRRNDGEMISLIHSEVYELYEALLCPNRLSRKLAEQHIYEFEEEVADIVIRLSDMVLRRGWDISNEFETENLFYHQVIQQLANLENLPHYHMLRANLICNFFHTCLGQVTEALREPQPPVDAICQAFASMVQMVAYLEITYDFNINHAIALKLKYNTARPHMHGKQF
ncbi:hypothetical protein [Candidatus Albibeggiatoa sp. nov. NOAA]|uniref:hypothetical protein n=1 Tax=Candidatus Albibeggiatoa sp. nov. NOAA TaxID=3162724 RepID=UPI0032F4629D|nr:hypothetical protein [Thiotrichaceae bacterium]